LDKGRQLLAKVEIPPKFVPVAMHTHQPTGKLKEEKELNMRIAVMQFATFETFVRRIRRPVRGKFSEVGE
jgi:hypothetical protein